MKNDEMEGNESQEWYLGLRFLVGGRGFFRFRFRREGEACFFLAVLRVSPSSSGARGRGSSWRYVKISMHTIPQILNWMDVMFQPMLGHELRKSSLWLVIGHPPSCSLFLLFLLFMPHL